MALESILIAQDTNIKVFGRIIWQMVKVKLTILMVGGIMESF